MTAISVLWRRLRVACGHLAVKLVRKTAIFQALAGAPADPIHDAVVVQAARAVPITGNAIVHLRNRLARGRTVLGVAHAAGMVAVKRIKTVAMEQGSRTQ